ncbi:hypothetical protein AA14337_3109 [Acetobacter malorum DSM 14337]|uniref:Uncharacterized protein n=1 Tax=Acetobacter malorum DSM 14337 TaxID=1307910 RepID=A0ABQ0PZQ6_9PROT|nr:hypothetical protein [Acetobacter malorum]KXV05691.1 hypothetical protein AD930_11195 [Acetobacter malorum]GBQ85580.1 hypothetical protein AA14337_3109 [Acetobacter malorum DSM 14337]
MPVSIKSLNPGEVVYSVTRQKMGNTTISQTVVHSVVIEAVDLQKGKVVARWNGNPAKSFFAQDGKLPWRRSKPKEKK